MKNFRSKLCIILIIVITAVFVSCSSSDETSVNEKKTVQGGQTSSEKNDSDKSSSQDSPEKEKEEEYCNIFEENFSSADCAVSYGFCIYNENISYISNNQKMESASIIKLFIAQYALQLIEKGELDFGTVIGSHTLSALVNSMITVSDNEATNVLIEYFGMNKLNEFFSECGYSSTVLGRKMLDFSAKENGKDNYTSVEDVMKLLNNLYKNKDEFPHKELLEIMKKQTVSTKIRKNLPAGTVIANKTGELSDVENDAGIIFSPRGDFALVVLTNGVTSPANVREMIAKSTADIYEKINIGQY